MLWFCTAVSLLDSPRFVQLSCYIFDSPLEMRGADKRMLSWVERVSRTYIIIVTTPSCLLPISPFQATRHHNKSSGINKQLSVVQYNLFMVLESSIFQVQRGCSLVELRTRGCHPTATYAARQISLF